MRVMPGPSSRLWLCSSLSESTKQSLGAAGACKENGADASEAVLLHARGSCCCGGQKYAQIHDMRLFASSAKANLAKYYTLTVVTQSFVIVMAAAGLHRA